MAWKLYFVVVLLKLCDGFETNKKITDLKRETLDSILNKSPNDLQIPPVNLTDGPISVAVYAHIFSIDRLDEDKMEFTLNMFLRQTWTDYRLRYDEQNGTIKYLTVNDANHIWVPPIAFFNEKKSHSPNSFIKIYPNGSVLYNKRISSTLSCNMNFERFPFDTQECGFHLSSHLDMSDMILFWREYVPVSISKSIRLSLFKLQKFNARTEKITSSAGRFSDLTLVFHLSRSLGYYVYHVYIPLSMLVILSWFQFIVNKKELTARLLIGIPTLLTSAIVIQNFNQTRPKVSYYTCMDCFTGTCLTFIFIALLETVIVHVLEKRRERSEMKTSNVENVPKDANRKNKMAIINVWVTKLSGKTKYIDIAAGSILPIVYIIFCIVYVSLGKRSEVIDSSNDV